jgi:5-methylcytosine-specific restriction endonuclease McrA
VPTEVWGFFYLISMKSKQGHYKSCPMCSEKFFSYPSEKKIYCSYDCYWQSKKGKKATEITKEKMRLKHKGISHTVSDEARRMIGLSSLGRKANWKGGICQNRCYVSWLKNKRNRVLKRIKEQGLSHTWEEWEILKTQCGFVCPCCKKSEPEIRLTEDHIIPLSRGGTDLIENIQPLCRSCNSKKHTLTIRY